MSRRPAKGFSQRESWLPLESKASSPEQRKRWIGRVAFTAALVCLVAWFSYLLFPPLFHPNVHFLVFTAADYSSPQLAPIPYFQDDAIRFISQGAEPSEQNFEKRFALASRPEDLDAIVNKSLAIIRSPNDIVLLYASFQIGIRDNRPVLLCREFEPSKPNLNTLDFKDFLSRLDLLPAKRVAVFLDVRSVNNAINHERVLSDSSEIIGSLNRVMNETNLSKVVVIASHSDGQSSYASSRYKATAFSIALDSAFRGACDRNNDKTIYLNELIDYVSKATNKIVEEESNGSVLQTPVLLGSSIENRLGSELISSVNDNGLFNKMLDLIPNETNIASSSLVDSDLKAEGKDATEDSSSSWQSVRSFFKEAKRSKSARFEERVEDEVSDFIVGLPSPIANRLRDAILPTEVGGANNSSESQPVSDIQTNVEETNSVDGAAKVGLPSLNQVQGKDTDLLSVVQICWVYVSFLENRDADALRPIDICPIHWQSLKKYLHQIETKIRYNAFSDERKLRLELYGVLIGLNQWVSSNVPTVSEPVVIAYQSIASQPAPEIPLCSLGMCEQFSKHMNFGLESNLLSQIVQYDEAVNSVDPELFSKWIVSTPIEVIERYREFQYAHLLSPLSQQSWSTCQRLLQSLRRIERLSFQPNSLSLSYENVLSLAHQSWLEAFRCAIDQIGDDWAQRTQQLLDRTEEDVRQLAQMQKSMSDAIQIRNEAISILPTLVEWAHIANDRLEDSSQFGIAKEFLGTLDELCSLLVDFRNIAFDSLEEKSSLLDSRLLEIRNSWENWSNKIYEGEITIPSREGWIYDALLTTSIDYSEARGRLLKLDRNSFARTVSESEASTVKLRRVESNSEASNVVTLLNLFKSKWTQNDSLVSPIATPEIQRMELLDLHYRVSGTIGSALETNQKLSAKMSMLLSHCVIRYKRLLSTAVLDSLASERGFLRTQQTSLKLLLDSYFGVAGATELDLPSSDLETRDLEGLYLETEIEGQSEVVFKNRGSAIERAWLIVDYDPSLVEIKADNMDLSLLRSEVQKQIPSLVNDIEKRIAVLMESQAQSNPSSDRVTDEQLTNAINEAKVQRNRIIESLRYPVRPSVLPDTPRFSLAAGQELRIRFKAKRLRPGPSRTKVSWKLVSEKNYIRSDLNIYLPSSDNLFLIANNNSLIRSGGLGGMRLLLNPNRSTDVRLGLLNEGAKTRIVDVFVYDLNVATNLSIPAGWLDSATSEQFRSNLGSLKTLAQFTEIKVEANRKPSWLQNAPVVGETALPTLATPPANQEESETTVTKKGMPISDVILANIVDRVTGRSSWEKIELRVKHPRSYVDVQVGYDSITELIEIELNTLDANASDKDGIRVTGRISEALPRGTEMKLSGSLLPDQPLRLYCRVPSTAPRQLTLELDIDDYPRAYVISVPCWKTSRSLPLVLDAPRLMFQKPSREIVLGPSRSNVPVELRVDAWPGAFDSSKDSLEVGWDLDQDREFTSETTTRFRTDRIAEIEWESQPSGSILFRSKVNDIRLQLSHPTVTNKRIQLLAKLTALGETSWSEPISIVVDEEPPIITGVTLNPGPRVAAGGPLQAKIGVDDGKLSGVSKVMLSVDTKGITSWDQAGDIINCDRLSDATWSASIPTSTVPPGKVSLLAIAEDRAGNRSLIERLPIEFLDPEEMIEEEKRLTKEVIGSVSYLGSMVADAKATLFNEKGAVELQTKSNMNGVFRWSAVPQGKYKLEVSSVIKNKPRRSESELIIDKASKASIRLQIELK